MHLQKLKKSLKKDLRTKRNKSRWPQRSAILLLVLMTAGAGGLIWKGRRPAQLLDQGIRFEQQDRLNEALERYTRLYQGYAASEQAAEALYRSGRILQLDRGENQQALLCYLQLENDYPRSPLVIQAQQEAAELTKHRLDDCGQAIPIYQRLIDEVESNADHYQYEIADCYARLENWSQAAIEFEALVASDPPQEMKAMAIFRLAEARLLTGQRAAAKAGYQQLVKEYPKLLLTQEARFRLAELLEEEEHLSQALQAYSELTDYPRQDLVKQKIINLKKRMARKKKVL